MEIKIIAIDMDGTFLNDEKNAPEENITALMECAKRGIQIVPATGRVIHAIPTEIRTLPGVRYAIAANGAVIADLESGETIGEYKMDAELAAKVMELVKECPDDIMYDAYINGVGYISDEFYSHLEHYVFTKEILDLVRRTRKPVADGIAYVRECGEKIEKVNLFFVDMEARERMRKRLMQIPGITVASSIVNNLEINAAGANKGEALLHLAQYLGIPQEKTMAFGDGENDISMIKRAGIGVAMENGEENVKAAADYITVTNNEAGVAAAIRHFVL